MLCNTDCVDSFLIETSR